EEVKGFVVERVGGLVGGEGARGSSRLVRLLIGADRGARRRTESSIGSPKEESERAQALLDRNTLDAIQVRFRLLRRRWNRHKGGADAARRGLGGAACSLRSTSGLLLRLLLRADARRLFGGGSPIGLAGGAPA